MQQMLALFLSALLRPSFSVFHYFGLLSFSAKIAGWLPAALRLAPSAFSSFGSLVQ
jgi:hypothetical protein